MNRLSRVFRRRRSWAFAVLILQVCLAWSLLSGGKAQAANPQAATYLKLLQSGRVPAQNVGTVLELICSKGDADDLRVVFDQTLDPARLSAAVRARALASLADAMQTRKIKPSGELTGVAALIKDQSSADLQLQAIRLASLWQVAAAGPELQRLAADAKASSTLRQAALTGLVKLGGSESRAAILQLTAATTPLADRYRAVAALAALDVEVAAERASEALASGTPTESPAQLIEAFLTVKHGPEKLAEALRKRQPPKDVAKLAIRAMYAFGHNDPALSAVLSEAAGVQADPPKPTPADVARIVKEAAEKGNAARGEDVFRRADVGCLKCHSVVRAGGAVGPELTPIGASSPPEYIVMSILDPNAAIKEQYLTRNFETADGQIITGIVIDRNAERVRVRDANNREIVIPVAEIEAEIEGRSLMPVGVTKFLTHEEVLDLVSFLSELGKPGAWGPRGTPTIQRWRVARPLPAELAGDMADPELVRTFLQNDRTDGWISVYAKVNGVLPLRDAAVPGEPADLLLQGEIEVTESGPVKFRIKAPEGTTAWLDGSPLGNQTEFTSVPDFSVGKHQLALRIPRRAADGQLQVEVFPPEGSSARVTVVGGL